MIDYDFDRGGETFVNLILQKSFDDANLLSVMFSAVEICKSIMLKSK